MFLHYPPSGLDKENHSGLKILSNKILFFFPATITSAIEIGSRRKATIFGKTSSAICDLIAETSTPINNEKTLMIGDRIDVDIVFGKNCGMKTLLVESGMNKMKDVKEVMEEIERKGDGEDVRELKKKIPDFYASGLEDLFKILKC